jgi:hypothetical protein
MLHRMIHVLLIHILLLLLLSSSSSTCPNETYACFLGKKYRQIVYATFHVYNVSLAYIRLSVFENKVLRIIFGPKRDEVTGEWRKLHNEELHILHSSQTIIRQIK